MLTDTQPTAKRSTVKPNPAKQLTAKQQRCLDWVAEFIEQRGISPSFEDIRIGLNYRSKDPVRSLLNALGNKGYITREPHKARSIQVVRSSQVASAKNGRSLKIVSGESKDAGSQPNPMSASLMSSSLTSASLQLVQPADSSLLLSEQAAPKSRGRRKMLLPQGIPLLGGIAAHSPKTTFVDEPEVYLPLELFPNLMRRSPYDLSQLFALRVQGDSMIESHILDGDVILLRRNPDPASLKNGAIVAARVGDAATLKHYLRSETTVTLQPANAAYQPTVFSVEEVDVQGVYTGILVRGVV
ncbi:MAG: transcriptional repressor LexA [Elainellaceae cyanobacterium]